MDTVVRDRQERFGKFPDGFPPMWVPIIGAAIGLGMPYLLFVNAFEVVNAVTVDRIAILARCQIFPALLFFIFTILTINRRAAAKPEVGHDPVGAAYVGKEPFKVLESNRVMLNSMESYAVFLPATLALATALPSTQAHVLPSLYATWTLGRVIYRVGYTSSMPVTRVCGFAVCSLQSLLAIGYVLYAMYLGGGLGWIVTGGPAKNSAGGWW